MDKDEIIRMAREIAEYLRDCAGSPVMAAKCDSLCEQIALVAENTGIEQQREIVRLKGIIEEQANGAQNLVLAEREACAKVCDTEDVHRGNWYAAAIRNRSNK